MEDNEPRGMVKPLVLAFVLGALTPLVAGLYVGGETVAQGGIRLAAIEQGFSLAGRHWQFEASPAMAEPVPVKVATVEATPAAKRKPVRR